MTSVKEMIQDILRREGGYVDHPNDRGGPTKYGVTQKTLARYLGRPVTKSEVRGLTLDLAETIYREMYFEGPQIDELSAEIQPFVFDCSINHGPRRAIRFVQSVCNAAGFDAGPVDGIIGPSTLRAVERAIDAMGAWFLDALVEERRLFYRLIVERDPSQRVFLRGWMNRVAEFETEFRSAA